MVLTVPLLPLFVCLLLHQEPENDPQQGVGSPRTRASSVKLIRRRPLFSPLQAPDTPSTGAARSPHLSTQPAR